MAFLGSVGKALGLDSEFGKGLVEGAAEGLAEGIKDDIARTKNNVDNLVLESYKGGKAEKVRFDKEYKENEKLIKQIASTVGGADGIKHPQAYDGAQFLITTYGIDGAVKMANTLDKAYLSTSRHPIDSLNLIQRNDKGAITASMLANDITAPVSLPDMAALGQSANVGIMKSNFFGPAYDASGEIEQRSNALLQASGIDINKKVMVVPSTVQGKIDPLVLGMLDNPTAERLRLNRVIIENDKLGDNKDLKLEANALDMIKSLDSGLEALKKGEFLSPKDFEYKIDTYKSEIASIYNLTKTQAGPYKRFSELKGSPEQIKIANTASRYYANAFNFALKNGSVKEGSSQYEILVREAIADNRKIIMSNDNGVFVFKIDDGDTGKFMNEADLSILTKKKTNQLDKDNNGMPGSTKNDTTTVFTVSEIGTKIARDIKRNPKAGDQNKDKWVSAWRTENPIQSGEAPFQYFARARAAFNDFMTSLG
tara:strand:+ start:2565 stop:4010 length:1446 start_codon:yes stop_codon:yes gene_type:complete